MAIFSISPLLLRDKVVPSDGTLVYKPYSKLAIAISEITGYFYGMRNMNYKWGDLLVLITGIWGHNYKYRYIYISPTNNIVIGVINQLS